MLMPHSHIFSFYKLNNKTINNGLLLTTHQSPLCVGYKPAVIGVVSSHRLGGYKHTIDKLPLNGGRRKPSAPV